MDDALTELQSKKYPYIFKKTLKKSGKKIYVALTEDEFHVTQRGEAENPEIVSEIEAEDGNYHCKVCDQMLFKKDYRLEPMEGVLIKWPQFTSIRLFNFQIMKEI